MPMSYPKLGLPLAAIALAGLTVACAPPPSSPEAESPATPSPEAPTTDARGVYNEVPLPPDDQRFGDDPEQIALDAFGMSDPGEGNFAQTVTVDEPSDAQAVVTLTQTGLLDDSVEGMQYRLEFAAGEGQWELVWAGRQVRCYPGRGSQDWSTERCA